MKSIYFWRTLSITEYIIAPTNTIAKIPSTIETGIQRGAVTHHQDQLMTLVSLSTKNTRNNRLRKLVPPKVIEDFALSIWILPFYGCDILYNFLFSMLSVGIVCVVWVSTSQ